MLASALEPGVTAESKLLLCSWLRRLAMLCSPSLCATTTISVLVGREHLELAKKTRAYSFGNLSLC
jgi:hypothetical protein